MDMRVCPEPTYPGQFRVVFGIMKVYKIIKMCENIFLSIHKDILAFFLYSLILSSA